MSGSSLISIERRRFAALIDALKLAHYALKISRCFGCGPTDSYVIAAKIEQALREGQEVRS
jgi:hypothetical protein